MKHSEQIGNEKILKIHGPLCSGAFPYTPRNIGQPYQLDRASIHNIKSISICSDGISSFMHRKTGVPVDVFDVMCKATDISNPNGSFMQRTMGHSPFGVMAQFAKENIYNTDDVSIGTFINTEGYK